METQQHRRSRLKAIFASLKERGKLIKSSYQEYKQNKQLKREEKSKTAFEKAYKRYNYGLGSMTPESKEALTKELQLMYDVGLLQHTPSKQELKRRTFLESYSTELEKQLRKHIEDEMAQKYGLRQALQDIVIAGMTGLPPIRVAGEQVDVSLKGIPEEKLEKIGTDMLKATRLSLEQRLAKIQPFMFPDEYSYRAAVQREIDKERRFKEKVLTTQEIAPKQKMKFVSEEAYRRKRHKLYKRGMLERPPKDYPDYD